MDDFVSAGTIDLCFFQAKTVYIGSLPYLAHEAPHEMLIYFYFGFQKGDVS
jgi:hypothetical protein